LSESFETVDHEEVVGESRAGIFRLRLEVKTGVDEFGPEQGEVETETEMGD
jgi:hypothetical protein